MLNDFSPYDDVFWQGVKDIEEQWKHIKFNAVKFMKGTSDRGFILGGVDEVMVLLDEHIMNLQGMSASRFIGPFRNSVYEWEKSLSYISEVIEVLLTIKYRLNTGEKYGVLFLIICETPSTILEPRLLPLKLL